MPYPRIIACGRIATIAAVVVLATLSLAMAQSGPDSPPLREGNIYDHQDHQPTQAEVRAAERGAGPSGSAAGDANLEKVEKEIRALLEQVDELDRQAEQEGKNNR